MAVLLTTSKVTRLAKDGCTKPGLQVSKHALSGPENPDSRDILLVAKNPKNTVHILYAAGQSCAANSVVAFPGAGHKGEMKLRYTTSPLLLVTGRSHARACCPLSIRERPPGIDFTCSALQEKRTYQHGQSNKLFAVLRGRGLSLHKQHSYLDIPALTPTLPPQVHGVRSCGVKIGAKSTWNWLQVTLQVKAEERPDEVDFLRDVVP